MTRFKTTLIVAALAAACGVVQAATLRVANQGDATSMDPHSLNESLQLSITGNVYQPLLGWTPGTYDAHNALSNLMATPSDNFMPFKYTTVK